MQFGIIAGQKCYLQIFFLEPGCHVADVLVDGLSVGAVTTHTITNVQADHTITSSFTINSFTITASVREYGSITPSGAVSVNYGANQTFTNTAITGYHILDVLVGGVSVSVVTTYTFTNVQVDHTIAANFTQDAYTLDVSIVDIGSVTKNPAAHLCLRDFSAANCNR